MAAKFRDLLQPLPLPVKTTGQAAQVALLTLFFISLFATRTNVSAYNEYLVEAIKYSAWKYARLQEDRNSQ